MSASHDDTHVHKRVPDVARIRELNDALRTCADPILRLVINGQLVITRGIAARGDDFYKRAVAAVRAFDDWSEDNDPHGEHDMAFLHVDGKVRDERKSSATEKRLTSRTGCDHSISHGDCGQRCSTGRANNDVPRTWPRLVQSVPRCYS